MFSRRLCSFRDAPAATGTDYVRFLPARFGDSVAGGTLPRSARKASRGDTQEGRAFQSIRGDMRGSNRRWWAEVGLGDPHGDLRSLQRRWPTVPGRPRGRTERSVARPATVRSSSQACLARNLGRDDVQGHREGDFGVRLDGDFVKADVLYRARDRNGLDPNLNPGELGDCRRHVPDTD